MLCTRNISGLPVDIEVELDRLLTVDGQVSHQSSKKVELQEIVPTLLNKSLRYPEEVYTQHQQIRYDDSEQEWCDKLSYDMFFLPAGLLGIEYCRTHVFKADAGDRVASIVQLLNGKLTVFIQKNAPKDIFQIKETVEDAKLIEMSRGDKLAIPANYYYTFINTGDDPAVFAKLSKTKHQLDPMQLRKQNGLAYYLISKNARREIVTNPRYQVESELVEVGADRVNKQLDIVFEDKPLYQCVEENFKSYQSKLV